MSCSALRRLTVLATMSLLTACSEGLVSPDVERSVSWSSTTDASGQQPLVIFVTSQGLFYDAVVAEDPLGEVPLELTEGSQLLSNGRTEFGPGQVGYLGGRWWEDRNNNLVRDSNDHFFFAPLQPPGRIAR